MAKSPENGVLSSIFHSSSIGMQILNVDTGLMEDANQAGCDIVGVSKKELLVRKVFEVTTWQDKEKFSYIVERLKNKQLFKNYIVELKNQNNQSFTISYSASKLEHPSKNLVLLSLVDVTEQYKLLEGISIVAKSISSERESEFFNGVTLKVAELFNADQVFVGIHIKDKVAMKTLSNCVEHQIIDNISYELEGTPCCDVIADNMCYYPNNIQSLFPKDIFFQQNNIESYIGVPIHDVKNEVIGALILLFKRTIDVDKYWQAILNVFAGKVAAELRHIALFNQHNITEQYLTFYRKQAPLASLKWDKSFNLISCNHATEKLLGYTEIELMSMDFIATVVPESEQEKIINVCNMLLLDTGGAYSINKLIKKNSKSITAEWHNSVIKDNSNNVIGAVSIVKDITEDRRQLKLVAQKEKDKREILSAIIDAVITINHKGNILTINVATETMFGYSPQELLGKNVKLLMPKSRADKHDKYLTDYAKTRQAKVIGLGREVIAQKKSGQQFPIRLSVAELSPDSSGNIRYVGTCHDLTEITQHQNMLQRMQKMDALGKLTGGISHDFNNLLGVISGFSELLERELKHEPKLLKYCHQISTASERGSNLIRKLLSFSKQESNSSEAININQLLTTTRALLAKTLTAQITIDYQLFDGLWTTKVDVNAFDDVILNLSINAKYAMPNGGALSIATQNITLSKTEAGLYNLAAGDFVCLTLTDNGCGMNSEVKQRLFEPFFTTKGSEGTGLGLSQVYGFITASHGGVFVYSEPNIGTSFKIYLPRSESSKNTKVDVLEAHFPVGGTETILVVDDEPALGELAKTILEHVGYTVFYAKSGDDALICLNEQKIDLMISDIIMPKINGYQLIERVKALGFDFPILLSTGFDGEVGISRNKFKNIPIMSKPYTSHELLKQTRTLLDHNKHHKNDC